MKRLILATMLAATLGWTQAPPEGDAQDNGDAPDHGVARISIISGNVSVRRGDSADLAPAAVNAPIVATDQLVTGGGSRAEVQFDSSNMVRLGPQTEVRFGELAYHRYQVQVAEGMVTFRVLRDSDAQVEISTPSVSVRPRQRGIYRIAVRPDGSSEITVRAGEAEILTPRGSEQIRAGQTMEARGTASDPEFQIVAGIPQDEWDRWNAMRDRDLERTASYRYVSPDVYGAEDLDRNGRWANDGQYGNVWVPDVAPGWAPYQVGRWEWIDYYGWTWVSDDPWGWAPYHYGRWYHGGLGWSWWPGPIAERHYWRPALVGFFGWGSPGFGSSFGFGFANVGWCPLAPFEAYRPWYGRGFNGGGFRNTTIINNTNITNVYRNARVTNAVSGMRAGEFGRGGVNGRNIVRASPGELSQVGMVRGQLPLNPGRESRQFGNRAAGGDNVRVFPSRQTQVGPAGGDNARGFPSRQTQVGPAAGGDNGRVFPSRQTQVGPAGGGDNVRVFPSRQTQVGPADGGGNNNGGWQRFNPSDRAGARGGFPNVQPPSRVEPQPGPRSYAPPSGGGYNGPRGGFSNVEPPPRMEQQPRSYAPPSGGGYNGPRGGNNADRSGGYNAPQPRDPGRFNNAPREFSSPQNPVRISPPIVSNRGDSGGGRDPGAYNGPRGGFGGPRPNGGGGYSAPRGGGGDGGFRGGGGGAAQHGGGDGGGGQRGGGGGRGGHR